MDTRILLRKFKDLRCFTPRRNHRVKAKWATTLPRYPSTVRALQNFDATYGLQLGSRWPSVRCALLSEHKYGALINNFSGLEAQAIMAELSAQGGRDFISAAPSGLGGLAKQPKVQERTGKVPGWGEGPVQQEARPGMEGKDPQSPPGLSLSTNIQCFVFPRGDITRFSPARPGGCGLLGYYLLDAASVLPVLVLDVGPGHSVLDICAAPGGKSLALLQTGNIRFLGINDVSSSRTRRLQRVLQSFVPKELLTEGMVRVTTLDGRALGEHENASYDRVLVDVPCSTDRHSLMEEENNLFQSNRLKERQRLPQLQMDLLLAGIQAVSPGGAVVYSSCSLSQLQNQCVVEMAVRRAEEELGISLEVVDLRPLTQRFEHTFTFDPDVTVGALVLPQLPNNFGPLYLAKMVRTN